MSKTYRAAAAQYITTIKDVTEETAVLIRAIWKAPNRQALSSLYTGLHAVEKAFHTPLKLRALKRHCIDQLLNTSGVEYLGFHTRHDRHVYYCNAGDTYTTTIIFAGDYLFVGDIGTLVERNLIAEPTSV